MSTQVYVNYHVPITLRYFFTPIPRTIHWLYHRCCWSIKICNISNSRCDDIYVGQRRIKIYWWVIIYFTYRQTEIWSLYDLFADLTDIYVHLSFIKVFKIKAWTCPICGIRLSSYFSDDLTQKVNDTSTIKLNFLLLNNKQKI